MRAALPHGSMLVSNEPDRRRASILLENMQKQGHSDVLITHNLPQDFNKTRWLFDLILVDAPCSGEGLFRKDAQALKEWSLNNVLFCQKRQCQILQDIWPCLKEGGFLICGGFCVYSALLVARICGAVGTNFVLPPTRDMRRSSRLL